jgi:hypothetical protein
MKEFYLIPACVMTSLFSSVAIASPDGEGQQRLGQVPKSVVGQAGQRQTPEHTQTNVAPMARINTRISNRVQNRVRNRIDRFYDPLANSSSPFEVAADKARKTKPR